MKIKPLFVIAILLCIASVYRLGSWGVIDTSEARYSEIPRKMYKEGDIMHPLYLGVHHYHKPPLTYWITTAGYHVFGPNAFGARIVLHLALIVQLLFIWLITTDWTGNRRKAALAVMIYMSFFIVWIATRNLTTDSFLNTLLLGTIWTLLRYASREKVAYLYVAAVLAGLAFLTKFTASLVLLGPVTLAILITFRDTWKWSWHMLAALVVYIGVALSWFLALEAEGQPILKYLLYDHSVVRYTTDTFKRNEPFWLYLVLAPLLSFPWLLMVGQIMFVKHRNRTLGRRAKWLFLLWTIFPILFYSFSHSKLILYILPAFPAVAMFGAAYLDQLSSRTLRRWWRVQYLFFALILIFLYTYPLYTEYNGQSAVQLVLTGLLMTSLLTMIVLKPFSVLRRMAISGAAFTLGVVLISSHFLSDNERILSTAKPVAEFLKDEGLDNRQVFVFNRLVPSLAFHLDQDIHTIANSEKRELQFETDTLWRKYYFNIDQQDRRESLIDKLWQPSVLVCRRRQVVPEDIRNKFEQVVEIGRWSVYY